MTFHLARRAVCPGNKQWYLCSSGFRGCCSVDPCNTGVCPDTNDTIKPGLPPSSSTATTATAASKNVLTKVVTSSAVISQTVTSPTAAITTSPSTSSQVDTASIIVTRTKTQSVGPTGTPEAGQGSGHGALIGGIVGGIMVALLLIALVLFLVRRSRRKHDKRFTLLRWRSSRAGGEEKPPFDPSRNASSGLEERLFDGAKHIANPAHLNHAPRLLTPESVSGPVPSNSPPPRSNPYTLSTTSTPSIPNHSSSSSLLPNPSPSSHSPLDIPSASSLRPAPLHPRRAETTPELSDTGFYRQRAELAAYSQSELINIPPERRQMLHRLDPDEPTDSNTSIPSIITSDGVVLCANFDHRLPTDDPYPRQAPADGLQHVLSFMEFPPPSRSPSPSAMDSELQHGLPVYRPEWRKSYESGKGV